MTVKYDSKTHRFTYSILIRCRGRDINSNFEFKLSNVNRVKDGRMGLVCSDRKVQSWIPMTETMVVKTIIRKE